MVQVPFHVGMVRNGSFNASAQMDHVRQALLEAGVKIPVT